jgi:hypothetical protein
MDTVKTFLKSTYEIIFFVLKLWLIFIVSLLFLFLTEMFDPDRGPLTRVIENIIEPKPTPFCPVENIFVEDASCTKITVSPPSMIITSALPTPNSNYTLNYESSKVNSLYREIVGFDKVPAP